ncbi:hypothetical protein MTO96_026772, partial [Rhipicephalus appendiculatus]
MRLSPEKTEAMLVHRSSVARYAISRFTLQGVTIPWKRRVTYLGVLIDHRLSWTPAIKAQCKSARRVASAARALLARGNGCSPTLALRLFNGMATARILYGLPLASISSNNWDKLEVVHRTAIRQYYSLPRTSQVGPTLAEAGDMPLSQPWLHVSQIGNADETLVRFDMPSSTTVCESGAKEVKLLSTGSEHSRFTVMLSCTADGRKLPPFIIFKRKTLPKEAFPRDVVVRVNEKG